jgi:hypothetical protein
MRGPGATRRIAWRATPTQGNRLRKFVSAQQVTVAAMLVAPACAVQSAAPEAVGLP